ncbi:RNA polymerase sigma factor [Streptomonospora wellingtoniae]|uniref:Sigma-70 family RNA polymerase sigma factor n=1 Tax=Streptomonospora wellingtoniae TaxID=3075544 RepID=A0ABU2KSU7_9ACTN|nr:sigma-70 family RNA polymerase sigma factor [Streptomonospora sp. DSM 45055]MDT0302360.1 sigma-70 family RNA polymerase sigma factor [Streptomonospora sp. DSM 45055]
MASQSPTSGGSTAPSARPAPPGRSSRARAGRHSAAPGAELAAALRGGTGYGRCYDLFADQLYRYCWSLVGPGGGAEPDRAADAVHETFLAAADRIHALRDDREFAAWLFALVRTAARRRGFAPRSPYAELATTDDEQAAVRLSQRLPPSHRELLELYLRHGLPTPLIARVLGLGAETAAELCRTAVLNAADQLARYARAPEPPEHRGADRGVRSVLAGLEPPGPPPGLRERVLEDCASPLAEAERRAAGYALAPLGDDGFPLHRNRTPAAGGAADAASEASGDAGGAAAVAETEATVLPEDRVTTGDVPARAEAEPLARPGGAAGARERRRPPVPVVALLAAAAAMICLWGVVAAVGGRSGGPVAEAGPAGPPAAAPSAEERPGAASAVSDGPGKAAEQPPEATDDASTAPSPAPEGAPPAELRPSGDPSGAPGSGGGSAAPASPTAGAPEGGSGQEGAGDAEGGSAEGPEGGSDGEGSGSGSGEDSGGSEDADDGISGFFDGLFGLLSGGGTEPPA